MRITPLLTDDSILRELGARLASIRLARNLTQAALAEEAGVSKRTVERLESGEVSTRLAGLLRVCRTLDLMDGVDNLVPEASASPMAQHKRRGRTRQRASTRGSNASPASPADGTAKTWTWGDGE